MVWQDILISIVNVFLIYSLSHQIYLGYKNKKGYLSLITTIITSIGLYAMSIAFFTLTLYFSALAVFTTATLWLTLFIQKIIYEEAK